MKRKLDATRITSRTISPNNNENDRPEEQISSHRKTSPDQIPNGTINIVPLANLSPSRGGVPTFDSTDTTVEMNERKQSTQSSPIIANSTNELQPVIKTEKVDEIEPSTSNVHTTTVNDQQVVIKQLPNLHLLTMPILVIEKIMSNILNRSNVARTCKILYEIVCQMEKCKRVICIKRLVTTDNSVRLTIDDDVAFDSIINSLRRVTEIRLDAHISYSLLNVLLNKRQWERITAIMKEFGTNITSLILGGITLSINEIIQLLSLAPKLESLSFINGKGLGSATMSLKLSRLKTLEIYNYSGLLDIITLIPAGTLNYYCCIDRKENTQPDILKIILTKQHNLKSLVVFDDPMLLCVKHMQLYTLDLSLSDTWSDDQLVEVLKCYTNLKKLRLKGCDVVRPHRIDVSAFKWICNNLKKLEVFKVHLQSNEQNVFSTLRELKKLRHFSMNVIRFLPDHESKLKIDSLEKLKIETFGYNEMVYTIVRTFTNLTDLEIPLMDFSQLSLLLTHCTTLIRLTSRIGQPGPHPLAHKCFPNMRHLAIKYVESDHLRGTPIAGMSEGMSIMISIVRAMPNLNILSMDSSIFTRLIFNVDMLKEFIYVSNNLEELYVDYFVLDDDMSRRDDFLGTIRRLSDKLKVYRLLFNVSNENSVRDDLSNEFNVRDDEYYDDSYFRLCKGDWTKFRHYYL